VFTGIVEEIGLVRSLTRGPASAALTVAAVRVLDGTRLGDSIAVNGVCLTVTGCSSAAFTADVMYETLQKTNLGRLSAGDRVNLERALKLGDRLGGHFVAGHVDVTGAILSLQERDIATEMWVAVPGELEPYLIPEGSVALDGVSLTIATLKEGSLMIGLIPHTRETTALGGKKTGDLLNIEADLLGKYVGRLLQRDGVQKQAREITTDLLLENGFI
jgi:riboflavin synthase